MTPRRRTFGDDRGAMLVHVALAILAIIAFTTFVADFGVLWTSRRQAQNSADAGAMAGAIAIGYDDPTDFSVTGPAKESAFAATQRNLVWGQPPSVLPATDITVLCPTCGTRCPDLSDATCVKVDVYRNDARGNALPTFFGNLVGLSSQGIQATATAKVGVANATDCLKPWAVVDRWEEHWPKPVVAWNPLTSTYDRYDKQGNLDPTITDPDVYRPPTAGDPPDFGTGFHPKDLVGNYYDWGLMLHLKQGNQSDFDFAAGWFSELNLFDSRGGNDYRNNIEHCIGVTYAVGDSLPINTKPGQTIGPTQQGVEGDVNSLVNQDPGAYWDTSLNGGHGGVAGSAFAVSPRVVAIPLVNPDTMALANKNGFASVPISNIMGFFVAGYDNSNKTVDGYLMQMPGILKSGGGPAPPGSFLTVILLVR